MAIYGSLGDLEVNADYPSIQPTLDLNFAKTKALDPRITFYRNSLATYTDDKGIIRTVPENVPRFDHDPTTGESLGLLIEGSRTNIALYSQALNNSDVWGQYQSTISQDSTISPSGQSDAYKITLGTSPSGAYQGIIQGITLTTSNYYTISCFVKAGTQSVIRIAESYSFGNYISANLSTKQITSNGGYVVAQGIQEYPNGWFRIYGVWDLRSISGSTYTVWDINLSTNSTSGIYCYAWGAQLEAGSFPTSYIPTSGSTVTRAVDACYINGTNFSSWYNPNEFTLYGEGRSISGSSDTDATPAMVSIDDNTGDNRFMLRRLDGGDYSGQTYRSGFNFRYFRNGQINLDAFPPTDQSTGILPQWTDRNVHKMAFGTSTISQLAYGDGINANITNQVTLTPWTLPTQMQLGFGNSSAVWNGHIGRIMYYPKLLINTQLQNLTA